MAVPNLNVGLIAAILLSTLGANSAYAATCTYSSTYTSGTTYTGNQCNTTSTSYFTAGGKENSCGTCKTGYTRVAKSMTHSSGCTFTMYDCIANANYATVVADCSSSSLSTLFTKVCNGVYGNYLGSSSPSVIAEAGLSSEYDACGVYNIKYLSTLTAKVIMCFKNQILFDDISLGSAQVSKIFSECSATYYADDYVTQYVITDWDGSTAGTLSITNYAQWDCCNNNTSCMGHSSSGNTTLAGDQMLYYSAKMCNTSGTCTATSAGGYITCNAGYYSTKGLSSYTLKSNTNPANYASYLNCTSCATATSNDSATSDIGASAITQCYLPAGYTSTDTTGVWEYEKACNYTN